MSRSFRKTPISGNAGSPSEKSDKQAWHKKLRRASRAILGSVENIEEDTPPLPLMNEVSNPWNFAKDGKKYRGRGLKGWGAPNFATESKQQDIVVVLRKNVLSPKNFEEADLKKISVVPKRVLKSFWWTRGIRKVYQFWSK